MARWKLEISHYQQYADDMVTPGIYAPFPGGGFFLDTNSGAGNIDPEGELVYWLEVDPSEVTGLEELDISYRLKTANELSNPDGSNYNFALSSSIAFFAGAGNPGTAYAFIKNWLIDDPSAPNNSIAVKLTKLDCTDIVLTSLNINLNQIRWDNKRCVIDCDMKEIQPKVSCFERTLIDDDFQGWFNTETTFDHPRMKYCNKVSPYLILIVMSIINSTAIAFLLIETIINNMIDTINNAFGTSIAYVSIVSGTIGDIIELIVGCKYEHVSPLVRTYFQNVCDKCGLTYNSTDDIFNSTSLSYLNDGLDPVFGTDNPYYNTVMFYPIGQTKGQKTGSNDMRWSLDYRSGFTGFIFAEELKKVFNAEWRIYNNEFCLYKKGYGDYINANALVFDFTTAPDSDLMITDVLDFEWDDVPRFAYMRGVWAENDALDSNNADTVGSWNSIVDFNLNKNPNFKGEKNNTSEYFAPTQFRFDNTDRDYVLDGVVGTWGGFYSALPPGMQAQINNIISGVPIHAILLERKNVEKARLVIWDPALSGNDDYTNSNSYSVNYEINNWGVDGFLTPGFLPDPDAGGYTYPVPDPYYNHPYGLYAAQSYTFNHLPNYGTNYWASYYIYSFPLHFDEMFLYSLYGNFYKQDDPQFVPPMRIKTNVEIKACCSAFSALGINGSGLIKLNCKCRVPSDLAGGYYDMWIYEIRYSAKTETISLGLHTNKYN